MQGFLTFFLLLNSIEIADKESAIKSFKCVFIPGPNSVSIKIHTGADTVDTHMLKDLDKK